MSLALIIVQRVRVVVKAAQWPFEKWHAFCEKAVNQEEADYRFMAEQARKEGRVLYLEPITKNDRSRTGEQGFCFGETVRKRC